MHTASLDVCSRRLNLEVNVSRLDALLPFVDKPVVEEALGVVAGIRVVFLGDRLFLGHLEVLVVLSN